VDNNFPSTDCIVTWNAPIKMTTMTALNVDLDDPVALPRKRPKLKNQSHVLGSKQGRLFAPFRALGLVTNNVPFVMQTRSHKGATEGPRIHIVTCIGKSWAMWEGGKMTLLFVGEWVI
jgi:U3 small nucleolar RNA-associated protein 21